MTHIVYIDSIDDKSEDSPRIYGVWPVQIASEWWKADLTDRAITRRKPSEQHF